MFYLLMDFILFMYFSVNFCKQIPQTKRKAPGASNLEVCWRKTNNISAASNFASHVVLSLYPRQNMLIWQSFNICVQHMT